MSSAIDHERIRSDRADFRQAMSRFCTGVTVIACGTGASTEAMTANSLTSVSLDPLLLLVSIRTTGRLHPRLADGAAFSVSVLAEEQQYLSGLFARPDRPAGEAAYERLGGWTGANGTALAAGALAAFECTVEAAYPGGDHTLFLGRVTAVHQGRTAHRPLVFYAGGHPRLTDQCPRPALSRPREVESTHV
ncbi:flavin reductase family protein (plasmid) [Streptomyces sp. NBC_01343]|uniref:flavin reductase family protein n=1 Tax=Streptomyces sp. NBC_01343 TaxID=2903832 RepID=UPI002E166D94|nr:flavin reductase family protein [Streptomyces sp. NBC_01343]